MATAVLLRNLDDELLVIGDCEFFKSEHVVFCLLCVYHRHIVLCTERLDYLLLHGGTLHYFLIHYLEKLGSESPMLVKLIMKSIYKQNKREIKHIGSKRFGVQFLLKSIYANNGLLYFHTELKNTSNIPFDIDYVSFKIVDKKVVKRTAMQEQVIEPLRAQNYVTVVHAKQSERTVFALEKFTIPDDKQLVIEVAEKDGGRHQSFVVDNEDIVRANVIDELSIQ